MARPFKVRTLEPKTREYIDRLILEGELTLNEIRERARRICGDKTPSRPALGRYARYLREHRAQRAPNDAGLVALLAVVCDRVERVADRLDALVADRPPPAMPLAPAMTEARQQPETDRAFARFRRAQAAAQLVMTKLADPDAQRLIAELLVVVAFDAFANDAEREFNTTDLLGEAIRRCATTFVSSAESQHNH
jgi:hypothetical protein